MSQYLRQSWGSDRGLNGTVNAVAQTPDGYLWVGTDRGLYRFDGQSFSPAAVGDPTMKPITHVLRLVVDAEGSLWIWMLGAPIIRYDGGRFRYAITVDDFADGVTAMGETRAGDALFSSAGQLIFRVNGDKVEKVGHSPGPLVISLAQTKDGKIWLGTRDSGVFYIEYGTSHPMPGTLRDKKINCLLADDSDRLWIGTDSGLALWDGRKLVTRGFAAPLDHVEILSLMQDHSENLWIGTQQGLVRYEQGGKASLLDRSEASPVTVVIQDRENNIWFSGGQRMESLRQGPIITFARSEGLPSDSFGPVYVDARNRVWMAPLKGGFYWMRDGQTHRVLLDGLASDVVYAIDGGNDDIWIGRQSGGLTQLHVSGGSISAKTYKLRGPRYNYVIYAVHQSRDGSVWAGTLTGGAIHVVDGVTTAYTKQNGLSSDSIAAIEEGDDGTMYFGTANGLSTLKNNHWLQYSANTGLPSPVVTTLFHDKQNVLWIGTAHGLGYLDKGKIHDAALQSNELGERILGIAEDRKGALWRSTALHVLRANREALLHEDVNAADIRVYGPGDGLRDSGGVRRSRPVVNDAMDHIWISTAKGLSVAEHSSSTTLTIPVITHLQSVLVDGEVLSGMADRLSTAAQKRIVFQYAGLSFSEPERIRYRFFLEGFDRGWSAPTAGREAVYTNLRPGTYRFHVIASNSDGLWSSDETSVPIRISAFYWQTWEFYLACLIAILLLIVTLYRLRLRSIIARANRRFDERLAERTRIAQELHDTLIQGFFSASMQLQVVTNQVSKEAPARTQLERILRLMGSVLDDGRNAVRGLRKTGVVPVWLEESFSAIFHEIGEEESITARVIVEGASRKLRPGVQDEIGRIGQEALRNAYRHADAQTIDVRIWYFAHSLKIEVRDDGCGIARCVISHGREGHWGIIGMRERAEGIGAKFQILNREPQGTVVTLCVPGKIAYERYSSNYLVNWFIHVSASRRIGRGAEDHGQSILRDEDAERGNA